MNLMRESVIAVAGLVKHFGPVRAVDGIDLHVDSGDIYALLGLNGAGKTTAIRMLLGMIAPTEGEVHLFGTSVRRGAAQVALADVWARTGYLVETPAAYPDLSVLENLHLTARLRRLNDGHRGENAVTRIMDQLGLNEYSQRKTGDLSLGNAQRLGIAKALIHQPDLLILDEPASGLDPAGVVEIRQLLQRLAAQGTAILLSSHILGEVARLATRIGVIHHGRILTELAAADVDSHVRHWLHIKTFNLDAAADLLHRNGFQPTLEGDGIDLTNPTAVAHPDQIATLLVDAHHPPTHLAVHHEDLEAFFLRLVGEPHPQDSSTGPGMAR